MRAMLFLIKESIGNVTDIMDKIKSCSVHLYIMFVMTYNKH